MAESFTSWTITGIESPAGRRWTVIFPADVLLKLFGTPHPPKADFRRWAESRGPRIFERAISRARAIDDNATTAVIRIPELG